MVERPNFILVMSDDHGYGDCGFTGHSFVKTPHLDSMASNGVVFNRFYASAPVCSPTRASVLTGRHPFRTNVANHGHYMRPQEVTIAEKLKSAGYVTGHFGKWHIGSVQADSPTCPGAAGFDEWLSGLNFFDNDPFLSLSGTYIQARGSGSVATTDAAIQFIKKNSQRSRPMLAVVWFPAPHDPHAEIPVGMVGAQNLYSDSDTSKPGYYREITLLDQQVGRLRSSLRELGIEKKTLLFYCSDNGGLVGKTSGGRAKKGSVFEGGLRVPAILEWPGKFQPGSIDTISSTADIYPTVAGFAGAGVGHKHKLDGIDLKDILKGEIRKHPPIGFWHGHTAGQATWSDRIIKKLMHSQKSNSPTPFPDRLMKNVRQFPAFGANRTRGHAAWNDWPWKLHRIEKDGVVKYLLYDLVHDPMESKNLVDEEVERVTRMKTQLESWQTSVLDSWAGKDYGAE